MHHRNRLAVAKNLGQTLGILHIAALERAPFDRLGVSSAEVVIADRNKASGGEGLAGMAADEPCTAGHDNGWSEVGHRHIQTVRGNSHLVFALGSMATLQQAKFGMRLQISSPPVLR